jgi:hypothetical protein
LAYYDPEKKELIAGPTLREQKRVAAKKRREEQPIIDVVRQQGVTMSDAQREHSKLAFLDAMARTDIITASCEMAHISEPTYYNWKEAGFLTQKEMDGAYRKFQDMIRGEITKIAFVGVPHVIVRHGEVQIDRATGREKTYNVRDPKILLELAKRHLPEWQQAEKIEVTNYTDVSGIPSQYLLPIDARELLPEEREILRTIFKNIEQRKLQREHAVETTLA